MAAGDRKLRAVFLPYFTSSHIIPLVDTARLFAAWGISLHGCRRSELRAVFLPFFTSSHIIPLVDTARLFAARGISVTIITTPSNAALFQASVDRDIAIGREITVQTIRFPSAEVGLPEGIENFGAVDSIEMAGKVNQGIFLLQKPMEELVRNGCPDCIVSDMFYPWTVDIAKELKIPRFILYATNCFYHCAFHSLRLHAPHEKVNSDAESLVIPGLPDPIEITRAQLEDYHKTQTEFGKLMDLVKETEVQSYGTIFTSYSELEPLYVHHYKNVLGRKCWHVGLPSHAIERNRGLEEKNSKRDYLLSWLGTQKANSVLYICFGSLVLFHDAQLREIAKALEESDQPFIWVVRTRDQTEEESWLPEGFEQRAKESNGGLVLRGWVPQVLILNHSAIGGFMTHCGWNSVLESVTAGVPLITMPLFAEQFYNEKLITQVLKIGVEAGSEVYNPMFEIMNIVAGKDKLVRAITGLMGGSEEAQEIRRRAKEMSVKVKKSGRTEGPVTLIWTL
ncbi:unnamed protein product [Thlaspi arvense]|uniref:Glycosyltransferase n=1 Tax=Thlaspi arvense TaxID=13288 RepID=A0AAU9S6K7_THLAR|nr:unnamed protein product [Thlaspi arvense]